MKGVAHLLKAFQSIPNDEASLTLVGHLRIPKSTFERYSNRVQHRYHVPRNEIVQSFLDADCLVFPSLFEGSALVLRECYGAGIGIIQSANSGDGAVSGKNGIVLDEITAEAVNEGDSHNGLFLVKRNAATTDPMGVSSDLCNNPVSHGWLRIKPLRIRNVG